jgi:elongation factor P--(R)-beta-lysine ligase
LRIGGRVTDVTHEDFGLSDAFGVLRVLWQRPPNTSLGPGDLVVVLAKPESGSLVFQEILWERRLPLPRGDGEQAHTTYSGLGQRLRQRHQALRAIRHWFDQRDFVEVETPTLLCYPTLDHHVNSLCTESGFLVTSPELCHKRLLVGGMPRIYEVSRCFRREEVGPLHALEFTLIEWYRAFDGVDSVMSDTEELVRCVVQEVGQDGCLRVGSHQLDVAQPFARLTVSEAYERYAGIEDVSRLASESPAEYFRLMVEKVEPRLAELKAPVFLFRYPITEASLARRCDDDARYAERFELFAGGIELCNGYGELTSPKEQRARFESALFSREDESQRSLGLDERFLTALEEGMPPASGNALGFDRLLMLALGVPQIAAVRAFATELPKPRD